MAGIVTAGRRRRKRVWKMLNGGIPHSKWRCYLPPTRNGTESWQLTNKSHINYAICNLRSLNNNDMIVIAVAKSNYSGKEM